MKTLAQLSTELKIPPETLYSALRGGKFPVQKTGRDWFIFEESQEFKDWLARYWGKVEKNRP